jgi:rubrerythrin
MKEIFVTKRDGRKEEQRLRNERELLEATKDLQGGEFKEIPNCVICMDTKARYTIVPCGHLCLCAHCSKEAKNIKKCPMCNTPIEKIIKTYFV